MLEILIKNGELPPSAAQDPATPTTPNRQLPQNLVFTAPADSPTQSIVFTAASPISPISPIAMEVSQSSCPSPPAPPPPPPPPLPLATFSVQLPTTLHQPEMPAFTTDLLASGAELDAAMLLSPRSSVQQGSPDPQPPQEVTSSDNANLDLKVSEDKSPSFSSSNFHSSIKVFFSFAFIPGVGSRPRNSRYYGLWPLRLRPRGEDRDPSGTYGHR